MSDNILKINGWTVYAHPLFLDQLETMIEAVRWLRAARPRKDDMLFGAARGGKVIAASRST
ncbi:hypothetical protein V4R08_16560 (plasmid) [Nitrobacter sp. NHB1]|uniref:hypothetical protein n=1 Tax=Nitrobacter sp. NHB1 TaxID=3119830 RepID=UPI002FFD6300